MCVSIRDAEGTMQAKCICPDGYAKQNNDDCAPIDETNTDEKEGKPLADVNALKVVVRFGNISNEL